MSEIEENPIIQRLKKFIASTGLSSTQFADAAGIPRPTLSQMLHGRNKSINNQMLAKLDENFPELDIMWLLFGRGDMHVNSNFKISDGFTNGDNTTLSAKTSPGEVNLFQYGSDEPEKTTASPVVNSSTSTVEEPKWKASVLCSPAEGESVVSNLPVDGNKRITSIIVLYSDNSFETFNPVGTDA